MGMSESNLKLLWKRFLISLPFFIISLFMFIVGPPISYFAVFYLVVPAFILSEPISAILSGPATGVFHSRKSSRKEFLMFSLPESRIAHGNFTEALDLLEEMIHKAPQRTEIYLRIVDLALRHLKDVDIAREAFSKGVRNLRKPEQKKLLADEYRRLKSLYRYLEDPIPNG